MTDERVDLIYYADQTGWAAQDWQGLWRYLNRLFQFLGPTDKTRPDSLTAQIQARRAGRRDEELAAMDPSRMSEDTRYLIKHMLIHTGRVEQAVAGFPNLAPILDVGPIDHPIVLDEDPTGVHEYYTRVGILL